MSALELTCQELIIEGTRRVNGMITRKGKKIGSYYDLVVDDIEAVVDQPRGCDICNLNLKINDDILV